MIALKLVFQSLAGVAAVGSAVAGGYQLMNTDNSEFEYLLVDSGTLPTNDNEVGALKIDKEKNYKCLSSDKSVDINCEVFKTSSVTTPVSLDLEKITSKDLLLKEAIAANKNYVLKVKKSFSELKTISLVTKDSSKTFATLTNKYKLGSDLTNIPTNLIIVQSINLVSPSNSSLTTTTGAFKCLIEGETQNIECDLYKTSAGKTTNNFLVSDFTSLTKVAAASELTENNYFVVDLKSNKFTKEQFRNKKISLAHVATASGSAVTKISDLIFDQAVVGDLTLATNKFGYPIAPSNEVYYVAQTTDIASTNLPDLELFTAKNGNTLPSKNFKCQISGQTGDSNNDISCQMFSLSAFDGSKNSVSFDSLKTSNTEIKNKATLTAAKYLKLKINTAHMSSLSWTSEPNITIDIVPTSSVVEATKTKYASLKLLAKEEKEKFHGKTQFVVAKASAAFSPSVTGSLALKCKPKPATAASECDVYKFTAQPTGTNPSYKDLIFTGITKVATSTDIVANNLYLVDLKTTTKYDLKTDPLQQVIAVTSASESSPTFNFNVESPLLGHIDTTPTSGKFIFLK